MIVTRILFDPAQKAHGVVFFGKQKYGKKFDCIYVGSSGTDNQDLFSIPRCSSAATFSRIEAISSDHHQVKTSLSLYSFFIDVVNFSSSLKIPSRILTQVYAYLLIILFANFCLITLTNYCLIKIAS